MTHVGKIVISRQYDGDGVYTHAYFGIVKAEETKYEDGHRDSWGTKIWWKSFGYQVGYREKLLITWLSRASAVTDRTVEFDCHDRD